MLDVGQMSGQKHELRGQRVKGGSCWLPLSTMPLPPPIVLRAPNGRTMVARPVLDNSPPPPHPTPPHPWRVPDSDVHADVCCRPKPQAVLSRPKKGKCLIPTGQPCPCLFSPSTDGSRWYQQRYRRRLMDVPASSSRISGLMAEAKPVGSGVSSASCPVYCIVNTTLVQQRTPGHLAARPGGSEGSWSGPQYAAPPILVGSFYPNRNQISDFGKGILVKNSECSQAVECPPAPTHVACLAPARTPHTHSHCLPPLWGGSSGVRSATSAMAKPLSLVPTPLPPATSLWWHQGWEASSRPLSHGWPRPSVFVGAAWQ